MSPSKREVPQTEFQEMLVQRIARSRLLSAAVHQQSILLFSLIVAISETFEWSSVSILDILEKRIWHT